MFFCVCEHYDDYQPIIKENNNECFICFEYKIDNEIKPINLLEQKIYLNNCACNVAVHNYCLKIWIDRNKSCPICRTEITENNNSNKIICNFIPFGITIFTFVKRLSIRFIKVLSVMLFFYAIIDFYYMVITTKYTKHNEYTYIPIPILGNEFINKSNNL